MTTTAQLSPQLPSLAEQQKTSRQIHPWLHLVAGASGGITTSIITSPLDVLRTRLQSDLYRSPLQSPVNVRLPGPLSRPFRHVRDTFKILYSIRANEGWRGLFRGLGPSLVGVTPATAIKFYVYGNYKRLGAHYLGWNEDEPIIHAQAAVAAGIVTATATNPIWLVKTRLQLDKFHADGGTVQQHYRGTFDCIRKVFQNEGITGFYRGLSASYLGTVETVLHLVLYERLKVLFRASVAQSKHSRSPAVEEFASWATTSGAAGFAKLAAVLLTYPHEVIRTRLRQAPTGGVKRGYTSIPQCFRVIWKCEGLRGFYGGLVPHLVRSIPSAVITLGVYEFVLRFAGARG